MNTPWPNIEDLSCLCSMNPLPHLLVVFLTFYYVVLVTLAIRGELNKFRAIQAVIIGFTNDFKRNLIVMSRHRRRHLPLRRAGVPDVAFGAFTMLHTIEKVDEEYQHRDGNAKRTNCQNQMGKVDQSEVVTEKVEVNFIAHEQGIVICDAAPHPAQADKHHSQCQGEKGGCHQPEVHLAPTLVHSTADCFGIPIIDGCEEWEDKSTENRIMEVSHNPVGIMQMQIEGDHGIRGTGNTTQQEDDNRTQYKEHWGGCLDFAAPYGGNPGEKLHASRYGHQHGAVHEWHA